ncbi:H/ACA snoRNP pseudouridylase subunit [Tulasnella sp. 408]|nr:H/ACA snoRNP pseudouridylase subunit [Tulasnella sp. 408]
MGPPDQVFEMGTFVHAVEDEMLCTATMPEKVPYFNAPIYLENKNQIGKVDEVLGPVNEVYFTVKMEQGMVASRFQKGDKVYIAGDKTLPIERFLPKPKAVGGVTSMFLRTITAVLQTNAYCPQNVAKGRAELGEEQEEAREAVEHQEDADSGTEVGEEASAVALTPVEEAGAALVVVEGEVSPEEEADSEAAGEDSKLRVHAPVPKKLARTYAVLMYYLLASRILFRITPRKRKQGAKAQVHCRENYAETGASEAAGCDMPGARYPRLLFFAYHTKGKNCQ